MIKKILSFLFGTSADIFNKDGEVEHNFPDKKWDDWHNRYYDKERADWRNHTGKQSKKS